MRNRVGLPTSVLVLGLLMTGCAGSSTAPGGSATAASTATTSATAATSATAGEGGSGVVQVLVAPGTACNRAGGDTYPDSLCQSPLSSIIDPLGYHNRECGSYVAWMEATTGHTMPAQVASYVGLWPSKVPASWIDSQPQVGDAAVRVNVPGVVLANGEKDPGHAMFVTAVGTDGPGTITVTDYNEAGNGTFGSEVRRTAGDFHGHPFSLVFIHFPAGSSTD